LSVKNKENRYEWAAGNSQTPEELLKKNSAANGNDVYSFKEFIEKKTTEI
jgi:hypothetical protein